MASILALTVGWVSSSHWRSSLVSLRPAGFGAADGGEPGVTVAAAPVAGGELAEVVTGAESADEPGVDEDVVAAAQGDVEEPVGVPAADDLVPGGDVEGDAAGPDGMPGRGGHAIQERGGTQLVQARVRHGGPGPG